MSYCRWSSDNWKADVYKHVHGGYQIHVAGRKLVSEIPAVPPLFGVKKADLAKWTETYEKQMDALKSAKYEDIGLKYDGKDFNEASLQDLLDRLTKIKKVGYNVPDFVFDTIKGEMKYGNT